jgi:hypothetical protein
MAEEKQQRVRVETAASPHSGAGDKGELEKLRARVAVLEEENAALRAGESVPAGRKPPQRPSFGMSEGTRVELAERGIATDEHTGETLIAVDEGVEPANDEARGRMEREQKRRHDVERDAPTDEASRRGAASGRHAG